MQEAAKAEVEAAYTRATKKVEEIQHHLEVRDAAIAQIKRQVRHQPAAPLLCRPLSSINSLVRERSDVVPRASRSNQRKILPISDPSMAVPRFLRKFSCASAASVAFLNALLVQAAAFERLWRSGERSAGGSHEGGGGEEAAEDHRAVVQQTEKALEDAQVQAEREKNALLKQMDEAR